MGLDISHDTWHGAYSAFMRWRREIARVAGYPPLDLMEGYYGHDVFDLLEYKFPAGDELEMWKLREIKKELPIKWDNFKPDPLIALLVHSDCDGHLNYGLCGRLANRLESLIPLLPEGGSGGHIPDWRAKTQQFVDGLRLAHKNKEKLIFR